MGFQIVFNILKIKIYCKLIAKCIFVYNLRSRFCRNKVFGRIRKTTMVPHLTSKKAHIYGPNFFQNTYCWFISEHFWATLIKPNNPFQRYWWFLISEHHGEARHAWPHPRKTSWFLLHAKKKLSTSNSFWDINN